jgi:hypothetical protein
MVFPVGTLEGAHVYAVPSRSIERLVARQAAVTTVDANLLRRVGKNSVRSTAVWLEMDEGRFQNLL